MNRRHVPPEEDAEGLRIGDRELGERIVTERLRPHGRRPDGSALIRHQSPQGPPRSPGVRSSATVVTVAGRVSTGRVSTGRVSAGGVSAVACRRPVACPVGRRVRRLRHDGSGVRRSRVRGGSIGWDRHRLGPAPSDDPTIGVGDDHGVDETARAGRHRITVGRLTVGGERRHQLAPVTVDGSPQRDVVSAPAAVGAVHRQCTLSPPTASSHPSSITSRPGRCRRDPNHLDATATDDATVRVEQLHRVQVDVSAPDGVVGELLHGEIVAAVHDLTRLARTRVDEPPEADDTRRRHMRLGPPTMHDRRARVIRRHAPHTRVARPGIRRSTPRTSRPPTSPRPWTP